MKMPLSEIKLKAVKTFVNFGVKSTVYNIFKIKKNSTIKKCRYKKNLRIANLDEIIKNKKREIKQLSNNLQTQILISQNYEICGTLQLFYFSFKIFVIPILLIKLKILRK